MTDSCSRIESKDDVKAYLSKLRYVLDHDAKINFQEVRTVDNHRDIRFTNKYTVAELFPDERPAAALRRELKTLTVGEYLRTVSDRRFPKRGEMREFGRTYSGKGDVYIKIRVEIFGVDGAGTHTTFVMSFHFAEKPLSMEYFPYKE